MHRTGSRISLVAILTIVVCQGAVAQGDRQESEAWIDEFRAPLYFAVLVEDVDSSVEWYRSVFGLEELGGSEAEDGSWRIENLGNEHLQVEIIRDRRAQQVDRALGFRKVGFQVPDVDAVAERVERATGERPWVGDFEPMKLSLLQLRDPGGNIIQLSSPLD